GSGPRLTFGRGFKVDRSAVVGTVLALDEWLTADHDARWESYRVRAERLAQGLGATTAQSPLAEPLIPEPVTSLVLEVGDRANALADELAAGDPSIVCVPMDGK